MATVCVLWWCTWMGIPPRKFQKWILQQEYQGYMNLIQHFTCWMCIIWIVNNVLVFGKWWHTEYRGSRHWLISWKKIENTSAKYIAVESESRWGSTFITDFKIWYNRFHFPQRFILANFAYKDKHFRRFQYCEIFYQVLNLTFFFNYGTSSTAWKARGSNHKIRTPRGFQGTIPKTYIYGIN